MSRKKKEKEKVNKKPNFLREEDVEKVLQIARDFFGNKIKITSYSENWLITSTSKILCRISRVTLECYDPRLLDELRSKCPKVLERLHS